MTEQSTATGRNRVVSAAFLRGLKQYVPPRLAAAVARYRPHRVSVPEWEQQYQAGRWEHLGSVRELSRYSVIAGYCQFYKPSARLLDVGCGNGVLAHHLMTSGVASYVGFDLSEAAILQARSRAISNAVFLVPDTDSFVPDQGFDVIVFNEVLYYLHAPDAVVERLSRTLDPGGVIIVSLFRTARSLQIGAMLDRAFVTIDRTSVQHNSRLTWDIGVFVQRRYGGTAENRQDGTPVRRTGNAVMRQLGGTSSDAASRRQV